MNDKHKERIRERKKKEKEQRRHEIILKSMDLFISRGYNNTTMKDIALEVSLSKATLYNYFNSKDDLYLAVATQSIKRLNEFCENVDTKTMTKLERILSIGNAVYEFSKKYPNLYKLAIDILSKPYFLRINQKIISRVELTRNEKEITIENNRYQKLVFDPLTDAIKSKTIRDDLSPIFLACTLASLTAGLIDMLGYMRPIYESRGVSADNIVEVVFEWVNEGLKPKK
jgi:AcrR family transcriptional regulator